jgi:hypothetical protein
MNLTSNRRAEELHRLLESDVRDDSPVTGPLLAVADALREVPQAPAPSAEFRTALRQRLLAVAAVQGVGANAEPESTLQRARSAGSTWKVQRRLSAVAAGAAVVTGIAGVSVGASRSLPGQPLYGMKRAAEDAQLATTLGTEARGKRHLEFARARLAEVKALAGSSSSLGAAAPGHATAADALASTQRASLIAKTLHSMDVETRNGANDLFTAFRSSGSQEPLKALNSFSREQYAELHALVPSLPAAARPAATGSLTLLAVVADDTLRLAGQPATVTVPTQPARPTAKSSAPSASTSPSAKPRRTSSPTPAGTGQSQPQPGTSPHATPNNPIGQVVPSVLPTIPPLPALPTKAPTELPTELPTLPDLGGLLGH